MKKFQPEQVSIIMYILMKEKEKESTQLQQQNQSGEIISKMIKAIILKKMWMDKVDIH